jgi:hypothetical protein
MSLVQELSRTLPKGIVITGDENTRAFECDMFLEIIYV